jgi:uncharacterized membrane protein YiaA
MIVHFMPQAEEVLYEIGLWVEEKNTPGSGMRFVNSFINKVEALALPNVEYAICKQVLLKAAGLRCVPINDWIIAFSIDKSIFTVHFILHGTLIR